MNRPHRSWQAVLSLFAALSVVLTGFPVQAAVPADISAWSPTVPDLIVQVSTDTGYDYDPALVQAADGTLLAVWYSYRSGSADLWYKTSADDGATWSAAGQLATDTGSDYNPAIARAADDTLWLVWRSFESGNSDLWFKTSTNNGASWSAATQLTTDPAGDYDPAVTGAADGTIWVVWSSDRSGNDEIWYKTRNPSTGVWSADIQLTAGTDYNYDPTVAQAADGKIWVVWAWDWDGVLAYRTTSDGGASWSAVAEIDGDCCPWGPSLVRAGDGSLWLASTDYPQVAYQTSYDDGATWSTRQPWTRFVGGDRDPYLAALDGGRVGLVWRSERSGNGDIWFGIFGEREDLKPPPYVDSLEHEPAHPAPGEVVTLRAYAEDETAVTSVHLVWDLNSAPQADVEMYDDGAHGDYGAGDGWYGVQAGPFALDDKVSYTARASDGDGNTYTHPGWESFVVVEPFVKTADLLFVPDYDGDSTDWLRPYFTDALDDLGRDYDLWDTGLRGAPDGLILNQYVDGLVIWAAPEDGYFELWDVQADLMAYLDAGGRLFITGQDIGYYERTSAFYQNYLHATYVQDDASIWSLSGSGGDPIGDGLALAISGGDGADNQYYSDEIDPVSPAVTVLTYDSLALQARGADDTARTGRPERRPEEPAARGGDRRPQSRAGAAGTAGPLATISSGTAGLRVDTGIYKVVYFSFGFEAINSAADRSTTMERVLAWIEADTTVQPVVQVSTDTDDDYDPALVQAADGTLLAVWYSYRSGTADLWYKTSGDDGATWSTAGQLATETYRDYDPALARAADDTLWLVWRSRESGNYDLWYKTSTDDGASWSAATQLTTDPGSDYDPAVTGAADGTIWIAWVSYRTGTGEIWYKTRNPSTGVWSADTQLTAGTDENYDPTIAQAADGKIWVVWEWDGVLVYRTTSNGGVSWSAQAEIDGDCCPWAPSLARAGDGSLWLASVDYSQIAQQTSGDDGATWSTRHPWTRFEGWDQAPYLAALDGGRLALVWESERSENDDIWFGILGEREDLNPPPKVKRLEHEPAGPAPGEVVTFRAYAEDETAVDTVHLVWELNGALQADVEMYDDGAHNDYGAGDGWYGVQAGPFALDDEVSYSARASDGDGNTYTRPWWESFLVVEPFVKTADLLFIPDYDGESTDWFRTYFTDALDDLGRDYDLWDTGLRGAPGGPTLNQYVDGVVIWAAPDWGFFRENDVQDDLAAYLDAGGRLFITGQDIGYYEGLSAFYQNYLHATYVQDDTNLYALSGQAGDPVGDGLALSISGGDGADNQDSPDEIDPVSPAVTVLTYDSTALQARDAVEETRPDPPEDRPEPRGARRDDGRPQSRAASAGSASPLENISSGTAGLRVDTGIYRVVYFSFGFEAINSAADRNTTMERVLDWLGVCEASHSLAPDWTLLAPNVNTDPPTDAELAMSEVAAQGGNALQLCAWLAGTQNWLCYDGDPPGNNFPIELGQGYFFQVDTASTWQRTGQAPGSPVPVDIRPTWSLVGIPRLPGLMTAEDLLDEATGQGGACTELYRWQAGGWVGHARGLPFNNFGLTNNEGYFARCASATTYIPGAAATQAQPESWPAMVEQETLAPVADPTISDIQVTNRRDVALTITWLTDQPSTGWVEYGDTPALGQTAYDDKGEGTVSQAHHVTLTGLTPETTYDFRVHSGETIDDNDGALYQVTTRATELPPTPYLAYGRVETAEGAPAVGALVRVWLVDEAGNEAEPVSALVDGYGYWSLSLPVDRCKDLQVKLQVTGRQGSSAEITQPACEVKPAPTVVAGVKGGAGVYLPIVMR